MVSGTLLAVSSRTASDGHLVCHNPPFLKPSSIGLVACSLVSLLSLSEGLGMLYSLNFAGQPPNSVDKVRGYTKPA
jgi:hypothetical protein